MAWLAVDKDGDEHIYKVMPFRDYTLEFWTLGIYYDEGYIKLPKGCIKKLIGRELTWEDEPVEFKEEELYERISI